MQSYLLVCFHSLLTVSSFIVDDCKIELSRRVIFLIDCQLQMVDGLIVILLMLEIEDSKVEVSLEVFGVDHDCRLVEGKDFFDGLRVLGGGDLETLGARINRVDVFTVQLKDFSVKFQLWQAASYRVGIGGTYCLSVVLLVYH